MIFMVSGIIIIISMIKGFLDHNYAQLTIPSDIPFLDSHC